MSFGLFLLGLVLLGVGLAMVWKTNLFLQWFGDLSLLTSASWLSWKTLGVMFMIVGFLLATNLLQLFLQVTLGRLFFVGG